jgi:ubiquinone/menaquinone biosynthesis C-methylase UbiE
MPANKREDVDIDEFKNLSPEEYEKKYVHDIYNQISDHFNVTRYHPWPKVREFLLSLSPDSLMIEVGCGNGKNLGVSRGKSLGCDICPNLLQIAKSKGHEVICCDALNLSYQNNIADAVISIAVIHHLTTYERRLKAVQEMLRILKQNGKMLIYVWAKESEKNTSAETGDCFVGWIKSKEDNQDYKRYYHFFEKNELMELCLQAGNCEIEDIYMDHNENWAIICKKTR